MVDDTSIKTVNMHQAKTELSRLVQEVLDGKRVRIARNGKPLVELRLIEEEIAREPGFMKGQIWLSEDFDTYSTDISNLFDGEENDALSD
jgi:antitoxin (DNA-binding transcriptional repressor) of toxin-antitoxin stability system